MPIQNAITLPLRFMAEDVSLNQFRDQAVGFALADPEAPPEGVDGDP